MKRFLEFVLIVLAVILLAAAVALVLGGDDARCIFDCVGNGIARETCEQFCSL